MAEVLVTTAIILIIAYLVFKPKKDSGHAEKQEIEQPSQNDKQISTNDRMNEVTNNLTGCENSMKTNKEATQKLTDSKDVVMTNEKHIKVNNPFAKYEQRMSEYYFFLIRCLDDSSKEIFKIAITRLCDSNTIKRVDGVYLDKLEAELIVELGQTFAEAVDYRNKILAGQSRMLGHKMNEAFYVDMGYSIHHSVSYYIEWNRETLIARLTYIYECMISLYKTTRYESILSRINYLLRLIYELGDLWPFKDITSDYTSLYIEHEIIYHGIQEQKKTILQKSNEVNCPYCNFSFGSPVPRSKSCSECKNKIMRYKKGDDVHLLTQDDYDFIKRKAVIEPTPNVSKFIENYYSLWSDYGDYFLSLDDHRIDDTPSPK